MILITCGTNEQPFDRLVAAAHDLGEDEALYVQHGASQVAHGFGEWVDFVSFDELVARMCEARVVISHAGVGSIILARRCGKVPIIVPRRLHLHEAVDDHQLPLALRLRDCGLVDFVEDTADLRDAVRVSDRAVRAGLVDELPGAQALAADLREGLDAAMARRHTSAPARRRARRMPRRFLSRAASPAAVMLGSPVPVPVPGPPPAPAGAKELDPQPLSLA